MLNREKKFKREELELTRKTEEELRNNHIKDLQNEVTKLKSQLNQIDELNSWEW